MRRPDVPPDVVAAAQAGDDQAFEAIVTHYQRSVFGLAYQMASGDAARAEELAQDVFLRLWRKLDAFDPTRPLRPWLMRLAKNVCLNALRKHRPPTVSIHATDEDRPPLEPPAQGPTAPEIVAERDLVARAKAAIATLPEDYRLVVALRHFEGLSYEEIAQSLDLPLGTVKVRLHRARERLRHILEPDPDSNE